MKLDKAYEIFKEIQSDLRGFEDNWGDFMYTDDFDYDYNDSEERYKYQIARSVISHLEEVHFLLKNVNSPVVAEGSLYKREDGRYQILGSDKYFTSGSTIEVWDDRDDEWVLSRVEYTGYGESGDYYIVALGRDKKIEGLLARIRNT